VRNIDLYRNPDPGNCPVCGEILRPRTEHIIRGHHEECLPLRHNVEERVGRVASQLAEKIWGGQWEIVDTNFYSQRQAERMRDPEYRAAYEQALRDVTSFDTSTGTDSDDPKNTGTKPETDPN